MRCIGLGMACVLGLSVFPSSAVAADCVRVIHPGTGRVVFTNICKRTIYVTYFDHGLCGSGCSTDDIAAGMPSAAHNYRGRLTWKFKYPL